MSSFVDTNYLISEVSQEVSIYFRLKMFKKKIHEDVAKNNNNNLNLPSE